MARVTQNLLLQGVSGKIGNLVVRQVGGQTIVQAANSPRRVPSSPDQQKHLNRFFQAQRYGKAQSDDPVANALYATGITARYTSAYTVAVTDFMRVPQITDFDARAYHGCSGDVLRVQATDDFAVVGVHLRLLAADGSLLEEGEATLQADGYWHYLIQEAHTPAPTTCEVAARDRPENITQKVYELE